MEDQCGSSSHTVVGCGKKIDMTVNSGVLRVVGNSCSVTVIRNEGQIVITGNKGHLQVTENKGFIGYTGNNGVVEVGTTSRGIGRIVYTGNGGTVKRMKVGLSGKCGVQRSSDKKPPPSKQEDGHQAKNVDVQSELRVNGVEVCLDSKSKQDTVQGVAKENVSPKKPKRTSTTGVHSCYCEARKVWLQTPSKEGKEKNSRIQTSLRKNIGDVSLSNFELENWCLTLATELLAL